MKTLRKILTCFILCICTILGGISFAGCGSLVEFKYEITSLYSVELSYARYNGPVGEKEGKVTIPAITRIDGRDYSVTSLGVQSLAGEMMYYVEMPRTITAIESSAFLGCTNLQELYIPTDVHYIADNAFKGCTNLFEFKIASDNSAFAVDSNGALYTKDFSKLISVPVRYDYGLSDIFEIPEGVETIGSCAFAYSNDHTIKFPSTVREIIYDKPDVPFYACNNLETIIVDSQHVVNSFKNYTSIDDLINIVDRVYIKEGLDVSDAEGLLRYFTSISSSKAGYTAYVRNA